MVKGQNDYKARSGGGRGTERTDDRRERGEGQGEGGSEGPLRFPGRYTCTEKDALTQERGPGAHGEWLWAEIGTSIFQEPGRVQLDALGLMGSEF